MNSSNFIIWIIIFGLFQLFCTSTSEYTEEMEMNNDTNNNNTAIIQRGVNRHLKYVVPIAVIGSLLAVTLLGTTAWLVYVKKMAKNRANDVENQAAQSQNNSTTPERFFKALYGRIKQKLAKKKTVPDVENPPEAVQSEQKSKFFFRSLFEKLKLKKTEKTVTQSAQPEEKSTVSKSPIRFFRSLLEKLKLKKTEKPVDIDIEKAPGSVQPEQKPTAAKIPVRSELKKPKMKKKKTKPTTKMAEKMTKPKTKKMVRKVTKKKKQVNEVKNLPSAAESSDRKKHRKNAERTETPVKKSLPEAESAALSPTASSFLEPPIPIYEKPSKNRKLKQQSVTIEEKISNTDDTKGLMQQLIALQNKSSDLKLCVVSYERFEYNNEEDAPSLKIELGAPPLPPKTSEPAESKSDVKSQDYELKCSDEEGEVSLDILLERMHLQQQSAGPKSDVKSLDYELKCSDEEGEIPLEILLERMHLQQQSAGPESEAQDVHIEMVDDANVEEQRDSSYLEKMFYYLLTSVYAVQTYIPALSRSSEPESEAQDVHIEMVDNANVEEQRDSSYLEKMFYYLLTSVYAVQTYIPAFLSSSEPEREMQPEKTEDTSVEQGEPPSSAEQKKPQ